MKDIERLLDKEKENLNMIKVPGNFEDKLKSSLDQAKPKRKRRLSLRVASLMIAVLILGYNADTLAQYGRKLIGYESVMNGTIKELNDLGKGQIIDKSHEFKTGDKINVDAIMLDDNNMVFFYSLYSPSGNVEYLYNDLHMELQGWGKRTFLFGGSGQWTEDGKHMNWVMSTRQTPKWFENKLNLNATLYSRDREILEVANIPIKIDRKLAVGKSIRMNIKQSIKFEDRNLSVDSLVASPLSTVVKGKVQGIVGLALDSIFENRIMPYDIDLVLLANGREVLSQSSSISTDMKGTRFEIEYEALPKNIKSLEVKLRSLNGDFDAKTQVVLEKGKEKTISIRGNDIVIKNVYEEDGKTFIDITTEESVGLGKVYLYMDGKRIEVEKGVLGGDYDKIVEGDKVRIEYTRTFCFKGTGQELELEIGRIRYKKTYEKTIYQHQLE